MATRRRARKGSPVGEMVPLFLEAARLRLLTGLEESLLAAGHRFVAGVDEAGRGCLAGPVVAAAVVVDLARPLTIPSLDDSKKLLPAQRERLLDVVRGAATSVRFAAVSAATIDRINILQATRLAMRRAVAALPRQPTVVLSDAVDPGCGLPTLSVVRGDALSQSIAAASIVAKVERDRLMERYSLQYPGYGLGRHKGYAAPEHYRALAEQGPTPLHRLTFRSVLPRLGEEGMPPATNMGSEEIR